MNKVLLSIFVMFWVCLSCPLLAQELNLEQLRKFAISNSEAIESSLLKAGWKRHNLQMVPDSNLVKRSWEVNVSEEGTKSYLLHFEFSSDTIENYAVYQFSDRALFGSFKKQLKNEGYKLLSNGKTRRKSKVNTEDIHKEKEEFYYNEKSKSLHIVKEVFYYGMFSFLVYSFRPESKFVMNTYNSFKK